MSPLSPREALIALNLVPGLGPVRIRALLEFFASAELVLEAPLSLLTRVSGVGSVTAKAVLDWFNHTNLEAELKAAASAGVRLITIHDEEYPPALRRMNDPPVVIYACGAYLGNEEPQAISIVGSRSCTPYGVLTARRFARELAEAGCTVISGLASGIDAAAHRGALDAGARTIGVLGSGFSHFFPKENKQLARQMIESGGSVISEFPMYLRPSRTTFPQRNRIVAAWSKVTLVVEAPQRSGSLHTARLSAEEYGNHVFAIPGPIDRDSFEGCHDLIRDGAILCASPQHILQDMGWYTEREAAPRSLKEATQKSHPSPAIREENPAAYTESSDSAELSAELSAECPALNPSHAAREPRKASSRAIPKVYAPLLHAIGAGHQTMDALCVALGMPAHELNPLLIRMQIERFIIPLEGARFAIVD